MKSFSQRTGLEPIKVDIQREGVDENLKTALWNALYLHYFVSISNSVTTYKRDLFTRVWLHYFHKNYDEIQTAPQIVRAIKKTFFESTWNIMFDLLEFIPNNYTLSEYDGGYENKTNKEFCNHCNNVLERFLSAYRFVDFEIAEITSKEEIDSIEEAINSLDKLGPVKIHLKRGLELFSDRINPDYRNSIKESISAVEAYSKMITGEEKATLGKALAIIGKQHNIHGSLKIAFNALYGYTSDAAGIRHALLDESDLNQEDAKFMLVCCSAFINYLVVKSSSTSNQSQ